MDRCLPRDTYKTRLSLSLLGNIAVPGGVPTDDINDIEIMDLPDIEEAMEMWPEYVWFDEIVNGEPVDITADRMEEILALETKGYCNVDFNEPGGHLNIDCDELTEEEIEEILSDVDRKELEERILDFASHGKNLSLRYLGPYSRPGGYFIESLKSQGYVVNSEEPFELTDDICDKNDFKGTWYHGTTSKNKEDIEKEGLRRGQTIFCHPKLEERRRCTDSVYITKDKDIAEWYAMEVANNQGGNPMIVKLSLGAGHNYPDIIADEDMDARIPVDLFENLNECCPIEERPTTLLDF